MHVLCSPSSGMGMRCLRMRCRSRGRWLSADAKVEQVTTSGLAARPVTQAGVLVLLAVHRLQIIGALHGPRV